jgi:L-2-hydroxyglutarate oxidase LhgO
MYTTCQQYDIPHKNCGKWIVAQDSEQLSAIQKVHDFSKQVGVPTRFLSQEEAKRREPDVRAEAGVLESPTTGIVDSHALMQFLEADFLDKGGLCAFHSPVTRIEPIDNGSAGWNITVTTTPPRDIDGAPPAPEESTSSTISASTLINSAGLSAIAISNMILPPERHRKPYYAKGTYFSYALSTPRPKTLVYPAPVPGHGGLGTHLTLDMGGRIRFGPDVEWTSDPNDYTPNAKNLIAALDDIQSYLPGIDRSAVGLDYVGIRPKLGKAAAVAGGKTFQDFYIKREEGFDGFVNLLGIESPGLTSSLAIAEEVEGLLYR